MDGRAYKTAGRKQMASKHSALDLIERIGRKSGLLIMPLWRTERLDLATHTEQILAHCRIDTVLDVGANKGQYRDFLREEVGWPGPIISFEPIPDLAAELRARNDDRYWRVEEFALGDAEGSKTLNVAASPGFSSFLEPDASQVDAFSSRNLVERRIIVPVRTLKSVIAEFKLTQARLFLKIDTQGWDLTVMKGIGAAVQSVLAIQTEASVIPIYREMPSWIDSIKALNRLGFEISGMFPVTRDSDYRVIEFDCVAVRKGSRAS